MQFDANVSFLTNINIAFLTIVPAKIPVTTVIGCTKYNKLIVKHKNIKGKMLI